MSVMGAFQVFYVAVNRASGTSAATFTADIHHGSDHFIENCHKVKFGRKVSAILRHPQQSQAAMWILLRELNPSLLKKY